MLVVLPDTLAYRRPVAYVSGLDVLPQLGATELQIIEEEATLAILLSGCDCIAGIWLCALTQNEHNAVWQEAQQCVAKVSSPSHPFPHCCSEILLTVCCLIAGMRPCALTQNEHNAFRQDEHQCVAKVSSPSHPLPHSLLLDTKLAKTPCKDPGAYGAGGAGALTDDICRYRHTSADVSIRQRTKRAGTKRERAECIC